jgi:hypothetical protein
MKAISNLIMAFLLGAVIILGSALKAPMASPNPCPPDRTLVAGRLDAKRLENGLTLWVTVCDPPDNPTPGIYCCVPIEPE